jgi:anti-sigma regulatory factor (Ser/Thr protein kinase)
VTGAERLSLRFAGTAQGFEGAFRELLAGLERVVPEPAVRRRVEFVFEEIASNIVRYGGNLARGAEVAVSIEAGEKTVRLTFDDDGPAFDPTAAPEPTRASSLQAATIGGLGIDLVRRMAQGVAYRRTPDARNRLVVELDARAPH